MSPEQLRESHVDDRTDVWSLGVVLYEMFTGVTPFDARSRNDTIAAILNSEPAHIHLPPELPRRFQEIVKKALEKDRSERYQTITKLASDLKELQRELERDAEGTISSAGVHSARSHRPVPAKQRLHRQTGSSSILIRLRSQALTTADFLFTEIKSHKAVLFAGATSVLVFLLFLPSLTRFINQQVRPPAHQKTFTLGEHMEMKPLTAAGTSVCSAISPDGKLVAHAEEQNGQQHLVVTSTVTSGSYVLVPAGNVQYLGVTFSPDNNYLYFTRTEDDTPGILYRLALPGGAPVRLKEGVDSPITFSPEGDRFAFVRFNQIKSEYSLILSNVDGTNEQIVATRNDRETLSVYGLAWSPDGGMVVCPIRRWTDSGFRVNLVGFDLRAGHERNIGDKSWFSILQIAWQQDMSGLVMSAREGPTTPFQLWLVGFPGGAAQKITKDLAEYRGVSISGATIVTERINRSWRIWVAALDALHEATAITSGVGLSYGLTWTGNGRIVFSSMAPDRLNISRIDPDGSHQVQLTAGTADNYNPAACAGGKFIVFASNRDGSFNIWRMNAEDGSYPKQLTFSDGNFYPSCSPDNQWVAYDKQTEVKMSVWKVPLEGGESTKISEGYRMPVFSPDTQFLACRYDLDSGTRDVAIFSAQGGDPLRHMTVPRQDWQSVQWLANGRALSYVKTEDGSANIWSYDLDTGVSKQLTNFQGEQIYAYAWSPDYKLLACQRGTRTSDVTMITSGQ